MNTESMKEYEIEILNIPSAVHSSRKVKAHDFEITEFDRLNFIKYEDTATKKNKHVVASYPAKSINIVGMEMVDEE